ncbi:FAD-dependent monooxygenase [Methylotenera sp. 1P/1]|uniref:FAD-dependent monooxygenase n=1 Tax=Methylotenera sp. 1P/1 TaxID=1131551 RepID=UPI000371DE09|nr:FAD-dependent monooxygenase [Methylotenera sp. 1P/1]
MTSTAKKTAQIIEADIVIVGAGLVGLTAAIAMAKQHKRVVLVDSRPPKNDVPSSHSWDARIYALTENTIAWLKTLGIWAKLDTARVNPIDAMELWDPQHGAQLMLRAEDANLLHMGCILENSNLMRACIQALADLHLDVTIANPISIQHQAQCVDLLLDNKQTVRAKLMIAADGVHSWVRQQMQIGVSLKSFQQTAIVANFHAELPHRDVAKQWFQSHETLALLPLPNQVVSMVWSVTHARAQALLALSEAALAQAVRDSSHDVTGSLRLCGEVLSFDLNQQTAQTFIGDRVVLVGDAAHQVHPMAGQGVNLGFRDVMQLTEMTTKLSVMHDIGDSGFLRSYVRTRQLDITRMNTLTSGLDALFATSAGWLQALTGHGMQAINRQAWLKKYLVQAATL